MTIHPDDKPSLSPDQTEALEFLRERVGAGWVEQTSTFRSTGGEEGERDSRGEMWRMRAKPEVLVVVGMEVERDLWREFARRASALLEVGA